jgi:chromosome segregation ATPase
LFQDTEHQHREECERLEQEKQELQARLQEQLESERALQLRLEALQSDGDMTQKQLAALHSHLHDLQPNNVIDTKIDIDSFKSTDSTGDFRYSILQPNLVLRLKQE